MWLKILILVLLMAAVGSLGSALFFMLRDEGRKTRTANALLLRVSLCAAILILIVWGFATGQLTPHSPIGLAPPP